ncbi:MAG: phosphoribosyltransferase family protein [Bacillota bacterium]|nr:phosphoribosyltransferase family protein [Bacillota bacterium]
MKNIHASTLSNKKHLFNSIDYIQVEVEITENHYNLPLDSLFTIAARKNAKRSFLFISKVLGKHVPIHPKKGLLTSVLLATRYYESYYGAKVEEKMEFISNFLNDNSAFSSISFIPKKINPIIIGFAETATALGHAFFDCFTMADYVHTTRESVPSQLPLITFEEEHSHATSHRCYISHEILANNREIILVDDELTTGKTALNIIRFIHSKFPRSVYTIVSILDFRSSEDREAFKEVEDSLQITIRVVCLLAGKMRVEQLKEEFQKNKFNQKVHEIDTNVEILSFSSIFQKANYSPFLVETGRFGIQSTEKEGIHQKVNQVAEILSAKRSGERTICLGTGEFMYIPMKIAAEMGPGVVYQSTTRSPIYIYDEETYGVRFGITFPNPENHEITHFVYNIPQGRYDDLFIFFEKNVAPSELHSFLNELKKTKIKSIKVVSFSDGGVSLL